MFLEFCFVTPSLQKIDHRFYPAALLVPVFITCPAVALVEIVQSETTKAMGHGKTTFAHGNSIMVWLYFRRVGGQPSSQEDILDDLPVYVG